jgi:hypothetical protein
MRDDVIVHNYLFSPFFYFQVLSVEFSLSGVTVTYQYVPNTVHSRCSLNVRVITIFQLQYNTHSRRIITTVVTSAYALIIIYVHTYKILYIGTIRIRTNSYVRKYNCRYCF